MNLLIFQNPFELFQFVIVIYENTVCKKKIEPPPCNSYTSSITWNFFVCNMESCYEAFQNL